MTDDTIIDTTDPDFYLVVGTNCYADAIDAGTYFSSRLHASVWLNASWDDKENALRQATTLIDALDFHGRKTTQTQTLAWPRVGMRDRDRYPIAADSVPQAVIDAMCEWALYLLGNDASKPQAALTHKQVGDLQLDFAPTLPDPLPPLVRTFLQPFLRASSVNTASIIP
jgi:hypothetical protein